MFLWIYICFLCFFVSLFSSVFFSLLIGLLYLVLLYYCSLDACLFSTREQKSVDSDGRGRREELGRVGVGQPNQNMFYEVSLFSF